MSGDIAGLPFLEWSVKIWCKICGVIHYQSYRGFGSLFPQEVFGSLINSFPLLQLCLDFLASLQSLADFAFPGVPRSGTFASSPLWVQFYCFGFDMCQLWVTGSGVAGIQVSHCYGRMITGVCVHPQRCQGSAPGSGSGIGDNKQQWEQTACQDRLTHLGFWRSLASSIFAAWNKLFLLHTHFLVCFS